MSSQHVPSLRELLRLFRRGGWTVRQAENHYIAAKAGVGAVVMSCSPGDQNARLAALADKRRLERGQP